MDAPDLLGAAVAKWCNGALNHALRTWAAAVERLLIMSSAICRMQSRELRKGVTSWVHWRRERIASTAALSAALAGFRPTYRAFRSWASRMQGVGHMERAGMHFRTKSAPPALLAW